MIDSFDGNESPNFDNVRRTVMQKAYDQTKKVTGSPLKMIENFYTDPSSENLKWMAFFDIGFFDKSNSVQNIKIMCNTYRIESPFMIIWYDPAHNIRSFEEACGRLMTIFMHLNSVLDTIISAEERSNGRKDGKRNFYALMKDRYRRANHNPNIQKLAMQLIRKF